LCNSARPLVGRSSKGQISKEEEEWASALGHEVTILSPNLNLLVPELFFLILAHSVYKMSIIK
jgi:hypothetical protein